MRLLRSDEKECLQLKLRRRSIRRESQTIKTSTHLAKSYFHFDVINVAIDGIMKIYDNTTIKLNYNHEITII